MKIGITNGLGESRKTALCAQTRFAVIGFSAFAAICMPGVGTIGVARASEAQPKIIAIATFESNAGEGTGATLTTLVETGLAEKGMQVVDRTTLEKALTEQALGVAGVTDGVVPAKLGQLIGAQFLAGGRFLTTPTEGIFTIRITRADTGEILPASLTLPREAGLTQVSNAVIAKILELSSGPSMNAMPSLSTEALIAPEILEKAAKLKLPSVRVSVPEYHIGRRVVDPAAETEIIRLLKKMGFPVVAKTSLDEAEIKIEGEAFSEFAMQAGGLVSCRARVELKALETANDTILNVAEAHASGVDVAETIAGKAALRGAGKKAGAEIITEIVNGLSP